MMVAIFLILFSLLRIVTIMDWIKKDILDTQKIVWDIQYSLSWLVIDAVILETN